MTTVVCASCGETYEGPFLLAAKELSCPCGGRRVLPSKLKPRKPLSRVSPKREAKVGGRPTLKRSEPKRDWTDARAKVEIEGRCRVCGWEGEGLEAGHIMGRRYDEPAHTGTKTLYVNPLRIAPLCPAFAPEHCHQSYDEKQLDLLSYLAVEEQAQAVLDAGSIESARRRLCPGAFVEVAA